MRPILGHMDKRVALDRQPAPAPAQTSRSQPSSAAEAFVAAQRRILDRYGVPATTRFVDVPSIDGRAQLIEAGDGPPLVMVIGGTIPAALWAPLMARLPGYRLHAVDLPGFGLTNAVRYQPATYRATAVAFLDEVLDAIDLVQAPFVTNSTGSLWTDWLSIERPERVKLQVQIGCPAHILGTTAPLPMRLMSVPPIGRLLMRLLPPSEAQVERVGRSVGEDLSALPEIRDALLACERLPAYADSFVGLMHTHMRFGRARREVAMHEPELRQLDHPIAMVWGESDPFGSVAVARRAVSLLPAAELHVVPGGHGAWFRHADVVGELTLRFLRKHTLP